MANNQNMWVSKRFNNIDFKGLDVKFLNENDMLEKLNPIFEKLTVNLEEDEIGRNTDGHIIYFAGKNGTVYIYMTGTKHLRLHIKRKNNYFDGYFFICKGDSWRKIEEEIVEFLKFAHFRF
jgi:hypothetical protein